MPEKLIVPTADPTIPRPKALRPTAACSNIGGREEQQDNMRVFKDPDAGTLLVIVCDGVGGSRSGGQASALVVETAKQLWEGRRGSLTEPKRDLLNLSRVAHERIVEMAVQGEKRAPASTITALYLTPTEAHWIHSGDTRIYHFHGSELTSRTRDHSVVQILVDQGEITEQEMGSHPDQGRLLQSLGTKEYRDPAYNTATLDANDGFILCTDGFWERTRQETMANLLTTDPNQLEAELRRLVQRAVRANGRNSDNATAVVVGPLRRSSSASPSAFRLPYMLLLVGVIALVAAGYFSAHKWLTPSSPANSGNQQKLDSSSPTPSQQPRNPATAQKPNESPPSVGVGNFLEPQKESTSPLNPQSAPPEIKPENSPSPEKGFPPRINRPFDDVIVIEFAAPKLANHMRLHKFTLKGRVFYMAETELTAEEWNSAPWSHIQPKETQNKFPVHDITAKEAEQFANKLTIFYQEDHDVKMDKHWVFRLPTLDEWLWVAGRAEQNRRYLWGEGQRSNDFGNMGGGGRKLKEVHKSNDGEKIWDLCGNVSEIVKVELPNNAGHPYAQIGPNYETPAGEMLDLQKTKDDLNSVHFIRDDLRLPTLGFRLVLAGTDGTKETPVDSPSPKPTPEMPAQQED